MPENKTLSREKVNEFKSFVKSHPGLIKLVREDKKTWKEIFEEWLLLGEEDEVWEKYRSKRVMDEDEPEPETNKAGLGSFLSMLQSINFKEIQSQIDQFSGTVSSIKQILSEIQPVRKPQNLPDQNMRQFGYQQDFQQFPPQESPFPFRRD
ncbi:spore coat protein YlbD [Pseudalkalibacillus caeni]|nr:spore coat protein YlbD [Pseudalkalibacillus caeni]